MINPNTYIELVPSMVVLLGDKMSIPEVVERYVAIQSLTGAAQYIAVEECKDPVIRGYEGGIDDTEEDIVETPNE